MSLNNVITKLLSLRERVTSVAEIPSPNFILSFFPELELFS